VSDPADLPGTLTDPVPDPGTPAPPGTLWVRMKADPQYAPEHLALEAVRRLGPEAAGWAEHARAEQPGRTPDELADQVIHRFTTLARISGAVCGATGLPAAVLDVGVLAWNQSRMVLHLAAAYGLDPTVPERATELLVLQRVHKATATARLALGVAAGRERAALLFAGAGNRPLTNVMVKLSAKLAQMAGVQTAKRLFARMIPGTAIVLGTWANSAATRDLSTRTRVHYRRKTA
jgi:hypothetical protein